MPPHLLIVDDEPQWVAFIRDVFGQTFQVEIATTLPSALAKLADFQPELIIIGSRQVDILQAIRSKAPGRRIIVATGQPTTREAINMYRFGVLDYFVKDFRSDVLRQTVSTAIKKPANNFGRLE